MEDDPELLARLDQLTNRAWNLSTSSTVASEGLTQIAVGLNALLDELHGAPKAVPPSRLRAAVEAADSLLSAIEGPGSVLPDDSTPTVDVHTELSVQKFVEAFRGEARKRLAGLSLSLTGVFNSEPRAIDQTIGHLHAIRGGAGMLGLRTIAELAGVMEDVVLAARRTGEAHWPVRPLLRGFAMLEAAIDDPDSGYDNIVRDITDELHGYLGDLGSQPTRTLNAFEDQPVTDVNKIPLQQRILVVDDVTTIAHSVGLILSELDIPIDVAHDGTEALEMLQNKPYSLVISDVAMPEMDGLTLTREIRRDDALSDLPVILLTSLGRPEERQAGFDAGANDYIVKGSIGGGELISRVHELLKIAPVVPPRASEEDSFRHVLVVEDIETIAASIAFVLSEGPYEIALAHNGREALDALRAGDFDLVISDLDMPAMNGLELIEAIRADPSLSTLPVVLLTARDSEEHRARAHAGGASKFLVKGEVGSGKLLEIVRRVLHEDS